MAKRVGIINGGGDCPGLNTVIDAIVDILHPEYEIIGFYKGFEGLLYKQSMVIDPDYASRYKFQGGTFLKTVNKGHFSAKVGQGETKQIDEEILNTSMRHYHEMELDGIINLGGDGSMSAAFQLMQKGARIIGVPKSIDNDLQQTDFTFGFQTAVEIATDALDKLSTTAFSHDRVMILEVMGRNAGWIALYSGIAGGADAIIIPEITFDWNILTDHFIRRREKGHTSGLVVVAEGAKANDGRVITKHIGDNTSEELLGGIGEQIELTLNQHPDIDARSTTLGHIQRGGSPCGYDRLLSTMLGTHAAKLFRSGQTGRMVTYKDGKVDDCYILDAISNIKRIPLDHSLVTMSKEKGICFGDHEVKVV